MAEQIVLLKDAKLSALESIYAAYSIRELGFDPIDVLQGIVLSSHAGVRFQPIQAIRNEPKEWVEDRIPCLI